MSFFGNLLRALPIIGPIATGFKNLSDASKVNPIDGTYTISPAAQDQLALAQTTLNGRAPGVATATQKIFANQGNTINTINQNATSGAQALSYINGVQGTTNNALTALAMQDGQYATQARAELAAAQRGIINEGDKVFADIIRKFNNDTNKKNQYQTAGEQNLSNGFNSLASLFLPGAGAIPLTG